MGHTQTSSELSRLHGEPASDLCLDPRWRLIERILATAPFQKSPNLRGLLSYLAEHSIRGRAEALTERQIGIAVFGKPVGYSPAEDSAVRVHVRQLRLRLHEYVAQEGRREALRVEIPKGSYVLEFQEAHVETSPSLSSVPGVAPPVLPAPSNRRAREIVFWMAVALAVICALGWYRSARTATKSVDAAVPWPLNAVIQPGRQTRIVVSDSSLMLRLLGEHETTLDDYVQPDFRRSLIPQHLPQNVGRMLDYVAGAQLTSFADLTAASTLMKLSGPLGSQLVFTPARNLGQRELEQGNYVFVGSPTSNPWVSLFGEKLNFEEVEEGVGGRVYFLNRNPLPGEEKQYEGLPSTNPSGEDYATISVLHSSIGPGNVMILQGLRQEGTEALTVLLGDPGDRARLEEAVQRRVHGSPYFEALIRSRAVAGAPVSIEVVATRSIYP